MRWGYNPLTRLLRHVRARRTGRSRTGILRHESGIAAVEFALILPIMVVLWIGGVEVTEALSVDRRLNNLASSIGDLVARSRTITYNQVTDIFDIAPAAMYPYDQPAAGNVAMRLTAVKISSSGSATVAWSRAKGSVTAYSDNAPMDSVVPSTLRVPSSQVIMAEVYFTYRPAVGYVVTRGGVPLEDRMFFVPRLVTAVPLCDNDGANCKS